MTNVSAGFDEALLCWEIGDSVEALRLWRAAADNEDDTSAQVQVGLCYELGLGTETEFTLAATYYTRAAMAGNPEAQFSLATLYRDGRGVGQDYARAMDLLRKSAASGFLKAHWAVGSMFYDGLGVIADPVEASRWYRIAAHRGEPDAQFMLGGLYLKGEGVTKDPSLAAHWMSQAAEAGDVEAQFNFGVMCYRGEGIAYDIVAAHKWINLSKVGGYKRATVYLETVAKELSSEQLARSVRMAQEFSASKQLVHEVTSRSGSARELLTRGSGNLGIEFESAIRLALGESTFGSLCPLARALLLKSESEYVHGRNGDQVYAAVLLAKAFEVEFNETVRKPLVKLILAQGYKDYPVGNDPKLVRDAHGNDRLTSGQMLHLLRGDTHLQRLLRQRGLNPAQILDICEGVIRLRNEIIHGDPDNEDAELLRELLLKSSRGGLSVLIPNLDSAQI